MRYKKIPDGEPHRTCWVCTVEGQWRAATHYGCDHTAEGIPDRERDRFGLCDECAGSVPCLECDAPDRYPGKWDANNEWSDDREDMERRLYGEDNL